MVETIDSLLFSYTKTTFNLPQVRNTYKQSLKTPKGQSVLVTRRRRSKDRLFVCLFDYA